MTSTSPHATGFFFHAECSLHNMGAGHPECPERLDAIAERLQAEGLRDLLAYEEAPRY